MTFYCGTYHVACMSLCVENQTFILFFFALVLCPFIYVRLPSSLAESKFSAIATRPDSFCHHRSSHTHFCGHLTSYNGMHRRHVRPRVFGQNVTTSTCFLGAAEVSHWISRFLSFTVDWLQVGSPENPAKYPEIGCCGAALAQHIRNQPKWQHDKSISQNFFEPSSVQLQTATTVAKMLPPPSPGLQSIVVETNDWKEKTSERELKSCQRYSSGQVDRFWFRLEKFQQPCPFLFISFRLVWVCHFCFLVWRFDIKIEIRTCRRQTSQWSEYCWRQR